MVADAHNLADAACIAAIRSKSPYNAREEGLVSGALKQTTSRTLNMTITDLLQGSLSICLTLPPHLWSSASPLYFRK